MFNGWAEVDVEVEVLGILVVAEVREHAGRAVALGDLGRDLTDDGHEVVEDRRVGFAEIGERWHVELGNHDDVDRPEWTSVVVREHPLRLPNDFDRGATTKHFVAVEVFRHPGMLERSGRQSSGLAVLRQARREARVALPSTAPGKLRRPVFLC